MATDTDPFGTNVPSTDIGAFQWGIVGDKHPTPANLGVLGLLENKIFKGQGYNCIFRPRSSKPLKGEARIDGDDNQDNDLQLNLTVETLNFDRSLGNIPNRGLFGQPDVVLAGLTYMQSVQDVTNTATGKADSPKPYGIHSEPGVWLAIPKTEESGVKQDTICRMASIPHGVTINAQGVQPPLTPISGPPSFDVADITPFIVKDGKPSLLQKRDAAGNVILDQAGMPIPIFNNQIFNVDFDGKTGKEIGNNRTPQNLAKFKDAGTITPEILADPNQVLRNAIQDQKIVNFIPFSVSTESTDDINGGGTANIAFLGGPGATREKKGDNANAFAASMEVTFWIATVECEIVAPGNSATEYVARPAGDFGPTFKVPPTVGRSGPTKFTVNYTQLQYSQTVILDFFSPRWPHVSVATLGEQTTFNLPLPPISPFNLPENPSTRDDPTYTNGTYVNGTGTGTNVKDTEDPRAKCGEWGDVFKLENVPAHASLLPTGEILYWGRRDIPGDPNEKSMMQKSIKTFLLDPLAETSKATISTPILTTGKPVNLFCSAHCFQSDGTLFVAGGHLEDGHGVNQACVYDPFKDTWNPKPRMNYGRWYPSALTLNDGSILALSGSYFDGTDDSCPMDDIPQIWRKDEWKSMPRMSDNILQSFPRLHLDPHGRIFMAGPQARSQFLDESVDGGVGAWTTDGPKRDEQTRDYAPSVMYDRGKIMYIGGGMPATSAVEFIDLNVDTPSWTKPDKSNMNHARRQHNATVLPDGTVLVTGGTSGIGENNGDFNDLRKDFVVHMAELWDPLATPPSWTDMKEEQVDRCYHSIALLLPDGRVLSAGGGEGGTPLEPDFPNLQYSHPDGQIFSPPYLFKGARPKISSAPTDIDYNQQFEVTVGPSDSISKVSWVRLGSVTHSCNMSQSLIFLVPDQHGTKITVHAPENSNVAPPGYYMLFVLNEKGVPSIARMVCLARHGTVPAKIPKSKAKHAHRTARPKDYKLSLPARNEKIMAEQDRPAVAVGLVPACPYGLGPCWGAAFDALQHISDIDIVRPVPDQENSIAYVYLKDDVLPDIDKWRHEFEKTANKLYHIRGCELTISGAVTKHHLGTDEQLVMTATPTRDEVSLTPFYASSKLEWDRIAKAPIEAVEAEVTAWARLSARLGDIALARKARFVQEWPIAVQVTGRLHKHGHKRYSLDVRDFVPPKDTGIPNGA